ncbi:Electron transport complex protein RnfC [Eubacteriaceae bacterium CHKCI005]|nr:Electron transport complex protein RnfC [Eubacteriaceae bacterium CHKCI005]
MGTANMFARLKAAPRGGAAVPHRKNTAEMETVSMPPPEKVVIPMQQHIGAPCVPTVKIGDLVKVGQVIGDTSQFVSAPIHASVSGKVTAITDILLPSGQRTKAVAIQSDGKQETDDSVKPPIIHSKQDFIKAVRESGLVGLGGAGFPAHVKLSPPGNVTIDTLVINGAECEPYITADYREAMENSWDVMSGIYAVKDLLGVNQVIIAIENNKPDAIKVLSDIAYNENDPKNQVNVMPLPSRYPQGAEKVLVHQTTGRVIPKGKLPSDVGVVVMNITSIAFLARYMKTGMPLIQKRLTVDGSAVLYPKNILVPIGTSIHDVMEFAGGYKETPRKLLMGGPMMGLALSDDSLPVLKQNNAILAFAEKDAHLMDESPCIRCGRCVKACPMHLVPPQVARCYKLKDMEGLQKANVMTCMECGCCSYVCPAGRYIVQNMRLAKSMVKNAPKPKKKEEKA